MNTSFSKILGLAVAAGVMTFLPNVAVQAAPLAIVNAGFETDAAPVVGASGWTITSGGTDWFTTTTGAPDSAVDPDAASEGNNWLSGNRLAGSAGSSSNPQTIEQLVGISADASLIDSGAAVLSLDFQFADNDQLDDATVNAKFFSDIAGTTPVGTDLTTGIIAETFAPGGTNTAADWELRSLLGAVPAGARSVVIELVNQRSNGSAGNVHFDDFSGSIANVPEPSTCVLLGLGCMAIACVRKRS